MLQRTALVSVAMHAVHRRQGVGTAGTVYRRSLGALLSSDLLLAWLAEIGARNCTSAARHLCS